MQKKVEDEGKKEEDLFNKFMCYCKNGKGALESTIAQAKQTNDQLRSSIEETDAALKQAKADLKTAQTDRADAKAAVDKATALRNKEADAFAKESAELKTNIAAMKKATTAIDNGMSGAFLQTSTVSVLKQISVTMDISSMDREMITSFLTQGQGEAAGYVPASGQISGILKQMTDTMEASLTKATDEESAAVKAFDSLVAAKTKEINALTKSLGEDEAFLKDLDNQCKTKEDEWAARQKIRAEELVAIGDTIKLLNDDDALELFKKTLPSASLLQLSTSDKMMRDHALAALNQASQGDKHDFRINLVSLALKGKKVSFTKVVKM